MDTLTLYRPDGSYITYEIDPIAKNLTNPRPATKDEIATFNEGSRALALQATEEKKKKK